MTSRTLAVLNDLSGRPIPVFALSDNVQNLAYNAAGGGQVTSVAFGDHTVAVLLSLPASKGIRIKIGLSPVADGSSTFIPGPMLMAVQVPPNGYISVISDDVTTGSLCITELPSKPGL